MNDPLRVLIAGGGIGGLAAALALARAGIDSRVCEKSRVFSDLGAGIQLGPNVTRILHTWGLADRLRQIACAPQALRVFDARHGGRLARLSLAEAMPERYGATYLTVHRAALHGLLLQAAQASGRVDVVTGAEWLGATQHGDVVRSEWLSVPSGCPQGWRQTRHSRVLVNASGLWSLPLAPGGASDDLQFTGHWAYRALLDPHPLPPDLAAELLSHVTLWLGPQLHGVAYPVRDPAGALRLNLVLLIEEAAQRPLQGWGGEFLEKIPEFPILKANALLQKTVQLVGLHGPGWQRWPLFMRPPLPGPLGMWQPALPGIARLGDAVHPMLPYLAQGAGMAMEDAQALAQCLQGHLPNPAQGLAAYAQRRWRRNAQVQALARRNARIFHADGPLRLARNLAMRTLGPRLLDQPWLWGSAGH